ncbi:MAG: hypothetical protein GF331_13270 [Chitinivibrionales bacterium]|nr:hypothetical protein [Chitinivibrionales bacterium]
MKQGTKITIVVAVIAVLGLAVTLPRLIGMGSTHGQITAGFDSEFLVRADGYPGLRETYDLEFASTPKHMDPGLMYKAVADGAVDVICGFATDGRIAAYELQVLEDDKRFFPPYFAAPLVRKETAEQYPQVAAALNALGGQIPDSTMRRLNYEVDENKRRAGEVAREFLKSRGLIGSDGPAAQGPTGTIRVGGKNFTEQEILGEMMAMVIEDRTNIEVERRLNLGGTMICFNALEAGDLDLYAEYTGTGLVSILKRPVITDPQVAYDTVQAVFGRKYDMIWLDPLGFNNTYTLTMREGHAEELGIETISDLARVLRKR